MALFYIVINEEFLHFGSVRKYVCISVVILVDQHDVFTIVLCIFVCLWRPQKRIECFKKGKLKMMEIGKLIKKNLLKSVGTILTYLQKQLCCRKVM